MKLRIDNIGDYLKSHNIKPSFQRMKIFEYLYQNRTHPTVDEIYKELVSEIPTLSKTTVYNTLNLFVEKDIAQLITIEETEARYDANTKVHGHFKCEKCKEVYDFETDIINIESGSLDAFQINQKHIYFKGICNKCL
ncbi:MULTISPECIES: Fur family transcriptional regulator [unclassified Fusibacter]|uniref:Fur family transcriptional regulator n=1 Tax=unclassified Fusibacter TaxID=2624464 RepID=UPI001010A81D|nr:MULTISPECIES: transcriptional repressor [unclassified Fusibacter]MCK8059254.1 transcriptional repressor [Fusibacter sp. A2]NPE21282.1 transcriptional repressor [Fusibacter sp. A1]RXV62547.1 transcriptional repressor [Fusibacter sp. A1]